MSEAGISRWRVGGWRAVVLATLVSTLIGSAIGLRFEPRIGDVFLSLLNVWDDPPDDIVIVAIDEDTLSHLPYRSPIDRAFLTNLIKRLDSAGPKVIGVDILIDQPSEPAKDAQLIKTIVEASTPVVMAAADVADGLTVKQAAFLKKTLQPLKTGLVTLLRDKTDGTVRDVMISRAADGNGELGLAVTMARTTSKDLPLPQGRITYYSQADGSPHAFTVYPAHAVAVLPPKWFAGKYVLIGAILPTSDLHRTPFITAVGAENGLIHGVRIHAHMLAQILRGERLVSFSVLAAIGFTLCFAILAALVFLAVRAPAARLGGVAVLVILLWVLAAIAFRRWNLQLPLAAPTLSALLLGASLSLGQWFRDRAQRDFIEKAFSQYVSPALVKRIVSSQRPLSLGGEKRMVTYVFTDLENFTALAEELDPTDMAVLLNEYLDQMCELFIDAEATIDKIVGDAVVGFFGAPEPQTDQTEKAVRLALDIDRFSQDYRLKVKARGIALGVTRIGVHRGDAVVGNFGGSRFFDYTSIGDTVNIAARLEAANKIVGTRICVSGEVAEACPDGDFRPIGTLVLKGKKNGIDCFEPLSPDASAPAGISRYKDAFALINADAEDAAAAFERLLAEEPDDPLARFHLQRLRRGDAGSLIVQTDK